jgi:hypothetical protein
LYLSDNLIDLSYLDGVFTLLLPLELYGNFEEFNRYFQFIFDLIKNGQIVVTISSLVPPQ